MRNEKNIGFQDGGKSYTPGHVSAKITPCIEMKPNANVVTSVAGIKASKDGFYQRNDYPKNVITTKGGI